MKDIKSFRFKHFLFGSLYAQVLADAVAKDDVEHFTQQWENISEKSYDKNALINQKNSKGQSLLERAKSIPMAQALIASGIEVAVSPEVQRAAEVYCGMSQSSVDRVAKTVMYLNMPTTQTLSNEKKARFANFIHDKEAGLIQTWLSTKKEANPILYHMLDKEPGRHMWKDHPSFLSAAILNGAEHLIKIMLNRLQDPAVDFKKEKNIDLIHFVLYEEDYTYGSFSTFNLITETIHSVPILKLCVADMRPLLKGYSELSSVIDSMNEKIEVLEVKKEKETFNLLIPALPLTTSDTDMPVNPTNIIARKYKI